LKLCPHQNIVTLAWSASFRESCQVLMRVAELSQELPSFCESCHCPLCGLPCNRMSYLESCWAFERTELTGSDELRSIIVLRRLAFGSNSKHIHAMVQGYNINFFCRSMCAFCGTCKSTLRYIS
jgi:hypothetical protein